MRYLNSKKGAFLPLLAMLLLGLLGVIFYLSIKAPHVRQVSAALRRAADDICSRATSEALLSSEMVGVFATEVKNLVENDLIEGAIITKARVYMPIEGRYNLIQQTEPPCHPEVPELKGQTQLIDYYEEQALSDISAEYDCGNYSSSGYETFPECLLIGYPCKEKFDFIKFPDKVLNQVTSPGNTIACELIAKIKPGIFDALFSDENTSIDSIIEARAAYWRAPAELSLEEVFDFKDPKQYPGLTIILDPYGQTSAGDSRFVFQDSDSRFGFFENYENPTDLYKNLDPLYDDGSVKTDPLATAYKDVKYEFNELSRKGISGLNNDDLTEHLVACQNPATLFLNTFFYTIVSMAERNWHFASKQRVLFTSPVHRHRLRSNNLASNYPDALNHPVLIAPVRGSYHKVGDMIYPPFVKYFGGVSQDPDYVVPSEFGDASRAEPSFAEALGQYLSEHEPNKFKARAQGWTQPFITWDENWENSGYFDARDEEFTELNAVISFQVANCRRLFVANSEIPNERFLKISGTKLLQDFRETNLFFESDQRHKIHNQLPSAGAKEIWQPHIMAPPWASHYNPNTGEISPVAITDQPRLSSVLSYLSVPQQCPLANKTERYAGVSSEGGYGCIKPTTDLYGDIVGALAVAAKFSEANIKNLLKMKDAKIRYGRSFPAIKSPGLFRIDVDDGSFFSPFARTTATFKEDVELYKFNDQTEPEDRSNILIVTRRAISGPTERRLITVLSKALSKRKIVLVYAPLKSANQDDVLKEEREWYRALVGDPADGSYDESLVPTRQVYVFSPYSRAYRDPDTLKLDDYYANLDDWQAYKLYWKNELTPDELKPEDAPRGTIGQKARAIWSSDLTVQKRLF